MKINLVVLLISSFFSSCTHTTEKKLVGKNKLSGIVSIDYRSDNLNGNFINIVTDFKKSLVHYNLDLKDNGIITNVIKYDQKYYNKEDENLDAYRSMEILVSDTSIKNEPSFFGEHINGNYTDTFVVNNVVTNKNSRIIVTPLSIDEKAMFKLIDSLASKSDIKYIQFDTSKILGWFKYVF